MHRVTSAAGLVAVAVIRIVYFVEESFEKLPIHWMWWPALGAIAVGVIGYFAPDTLGVGYYNITAILSNDLPLTAIAFLCVMKFVSWSIALGSGTSGGTLAPLFTIGGGLGALLGAAATVLLPAAGIDPRGRHWRAWRRSSRGRRARCWHRPCSRSRRHAPVSWA